MGPRSREKGQAGSGRGYLHRGAPRGSLRHPVPCLLDEANDKFAHFDRLVRLESDDLLPTSRRWSGPYQDPSP